MVASESHQIFNPPESSRAIDFRTRFIIEARSHSPFLSSGVLLMKRLLLLSAFLLAMSACSTTPEPSNANSSNTGANTNAAANTNTSATPTAETNSPSDAIIVKEKEIWDKIKTKNMDALGSMLADDFIYVSGDGVSDKAGTINGLKGIDFTDVSFSDWKTIMLDKDAAVVTYTVTAKGTNNGQPIPATPLRAASAWVNRNGTWVGVYHQETEIKEAAQPTSSPQTAAKASQSPPPPAKPAEMTADAAANEKLVWDAIKRKDADAFASYLTEDSLEVEPMGVYDKAGSVKTITMFDASKAALSDFKTVKLDGDASLVTYMVKGPSPDFGKLGERHSTIWINRGGKWMAAFHEGTTVTLPMTPAAKK
jgi:hypothetical protein